MNREVEELDRQYRRLTQFITEALGYGDTNIGTEESPLIVEVSDTVRIVDPDYPDADPPLEWAVEYIERELGIVGNFLAPGARPEEDEALRDSIATHGVQLPILVDHCGNIIDGRRRNRICQELGLPCPAIVVGALSLEQKKQLAMELNTCRTQLTRRQKQHIAVELLKCDARDSDRVIGRIAGLDHTTVGQFDADLLQMVQFAKCGNVVDVTARSTLAVLSPLTKRDAKRRCRSLATFGQTVRSLTFTPPRSDHAGWRQRQRRTVVISGGLCQTTQFNYTTVASRNSTPEPVSYPIL